ncbi:beta-ketoacyl synthase N-terminal-like domain-containing protein [Micromonospora sp. NPDC000207]|uniref:type I polyketide synthase n=1 Tax=Micromonospora sp. NPDC000207 TaxID=3154246 RepID=UPI00331AA3CB
MNPDDAVAVIGMSGRFPGAPDVDAFWRLVVDGGVAATRFSRDELLAAGVSEHEIDADGYVPVGYRVDGWDRFDAAFFGYSPAEAAMMDPQHRLALQACWQALERAGYPPGDAAAPIGVFLSAPSSAYLEQRILPQGTGGRGSDELQRAIGTDPGMLALRVSYRLNLTGPSLTVQTACSSSLVAVHLAVQSLLTRECDTALAGGAAVRLLDRRGYRYEEGSILSPDGMCRPFDGDAAGTVSGDGVGVVVLKRLADALADRDHVDALIIGSAVNNDGGRKVGFTAPSSTGQSAVIDEALAVAAVSPADVQYVEAHGTGTLLGDPIEVRALTEVFARAPRTEPCLLGSVKSNIGHLDAAAGVAALIKTVLALRHGVVPGTAHFRTPSPHLNLKPELFRVSGEPTAWPAPPPGAPRRAGVSAFGVGGTNAHLVLQAAPTHAETTDDGVGVRVLPLSGRTVEGLLSTAGRTAAVLAGADRVSLTDLAYTLQRRRRPLTARACVVARDLDEAVDALSGLTAQDVSTVGTDDDRPPEVVLMFPGQGSQYAGMGADLYRDEPVFRQAMEDCADAFRPHLRFDVREVAFGDDEELLRQTEYTQPTVFAVGYATGRLLLHAGIEPAAMIGHSLGEYVAACLAGVFTLPGAARVVAARGALVQRAAPGRMISVALGPEELDTVVRGHGTIAAVNGAHLCVLAGTGEEIAAAERLLAARNVPVRPLATSHAFHTPSMDPVLADFAAVVADVTRNAPTRPLVSNVTGRLLTAEQATSPDYWVTHLRRPVRFADGLSGLLDTDCRRVLVEAGPGSALTAMARLTGTTSALVPLLGRRDRPTSPVAALWRTGVEIDWSVRGATGRVVPLPGVEFDGREHVLPRPRVGEAPTDEPAAPSRWTYAPVWHRGGRRSADPVGTPQTWLVVEDAAGLARRIGGLLRAAGDDVESVTAAALTTDPDEPRRLVQALADAGRLPSRVLYAGTILGAETMTGADGAGGAGGAGSAGGANGASGSVASLGRVHSDGLRDLVAVTQALNELGHVDGLGVVVLTDRLQEVAGSVPVRPERATVHGAVTVLPQEFTGLSCRAVDVELPPADAQDGWDDLAATLHGEVRATVCADESFVAYRDGFRWRRAFAPVELPGGAGVWRPDGAYLLFGVGTRTGLMVAEELTARGARVVGVTGRVASAADRPDGLTALRERAGDRLTVLTADLLDGVQVTAVVQEALVRLGRLDGVFHLLDDRASGMVAMKSATDVTATVDARVRSVALLGAALDRVAGDRPHGFLVLGSSITGVVGGFGQLENCAVATFLETYAQARTAPGRPVTAVHWGQWAWDDWFEEQMAELPEIRADYRRQRERYGIPVAEGWERTGAAVAGGLPSVLVSTRDLRDVLTEQRQLTAAGFASAVVAPDEAADPDWDPARLWPDDEVAQQIATVWREVLGVTLDDPDTDFYTVGGNSLFAIQVVARLRQIFGPLPMSVIFDAPSVAGLAAAIRTQQTRSLADEEIASMLDEVEAMSPEELEALLAADNG